MKLQDIPTTDPTVQRARLVLLADTLRNLKTDFPNHNWDYSVVERKEDCGTAGCAWGLAMMMWPKAYEAAWESIIGGTGMYWDLPGPVLGLGYDAATYIFVEHGDYENMADVPPEVVADRIDAYLRKTA